MPVWLAQSSSPNNMLSQLGNDPLPVLVFGALVIGLILVIISQYINNRAGSIEFKESIKDLDQAQTANARYKVLDKLFLKYVDENLKRSRSIFRLTVVIIILGFVFVLVGVAIAFFPVIQATSSTNGIANPPALTVDDSYTLASSLSVIAGLVTNFIAIVILAVFRSSNRQNTEYFHSVEESLERQNAIDILEKIENPNNKNAPADILAAQLEVMRMVFGRTVSNTQVEREDE